MRKDRGTDYQLPTGRALDIIDTRNQLKPHQSFAPEAITVRAHPVKVDPTTQETEEAFFATPPAWTEDGLCVGEWSTFDEPDKTTLERVVKPACHTCPVFFACGMTALLEEVDPGSGRPLPPGHRAGVRGGMTPRERAAHTTPRPDTCPHGHDLSGDKSWYSTDGRWLCRVCTKERKHRYRSSGAPKTLDCPTCGGTFARGSLHRHMRVKHGWEREDAA